MCITRAALIDIGSHRIEVPEMMGSCDMLQEANIRRKYGMRDITLMLPEAGVGGVGRQLGWSMRAGWSTGSKPNEKSICRLPAWRSMHSCSSSSQSCVAAHQDRSCSNTSVATLSGNRRLL